jgi:signal transduction histidine kinase/ligand-binding sensor domain-containing protein
MTHYPAPEPVRERASARHRVDSEVWTKPLATLLLLAGLALPAMGLNPRRAFTQYTRTVWTQEHGLPQDTIRAITQTKDGYLWLGTDEGLAQFDGFEFVVFSKENGALPSNSVNALWAAGDGSLWIGTPGGLTVYRNRKFTTYTKKDGLGDSFVNAITEDRSGALWVAAGAGLSRFENGKFTNYNPRRDLPFEAIRTVYTGRDGVVYAAGLAGVAERQGDRFVSLISSSSGMQDNLVGTLTQDRQGNLWLAGSLGLVMRTPGGKLRRFTTADGLPDNVVRSLWEDRNGNLWAGTNAGLARLENGRFTSNRPASARESDWVRCIYEDTEGNLWVGMNSGLSRFRDDAFTNYGEAEGLPSDEPNTVFQDHRGGIWIGFHDRGLALLSGDKPQVYTTGDGLPSNEIFSIREDRSGDLLLATRDGLSRMHAGHFSNQVVDDRHLVYDVLEDHRGRVWVGTPAGVSVLEGHRARNVIPGGPLLNNSAVVLCETRDGAMWAGTYGQGLWVLKDGAPRLYTTADGLANDQIRSLVEDPDGTLWIGTFGGGLNALRNGRFFHVTRKEGLLSDNISHVEDDGRGSLWLSTTRGICRVGKQQLNDYLSGKIHSITPVNYGAADGLRSAQCAPGYPSSGGGTRTSDGRLWFPTSRGLAVLDPNQAPPSLAAPVVHLTDVQIDGKSAALDKSADLPAGNGRIQFRYTGIYLSAPERVLYSYRLEGLDRDWIGPTSRRVTNYNSLAHGRYRFVVRAVIPGGLASEAAFGFELLPHYYETAWFRCLCLAAFAAAMWGLYQLRVHQIRQRFAFVLEERARLAREIHDTLAQGFVGISSQLDAVAISLSGRVDLARKHLELARKMARHSLTEARRSMMDLRSSALEGQDLAAALSEAARQWTAGSSVSVEMEIVGAGRELPEEMEQHLLRIAQEAVTNTVKHSHAGKVLIRLALEPRCVSLLVADDGQGFEPEEAFSEGGGHFGLLGMRERAERLGGVLDLESEPGRGTRLTVNVPLTSQREEPIAEPMPEKSGVTH